MGPMKQAITQRVGLIGIPDGRVPTLHRELTGNECGALLGSIFNDLHQIPPLRFSQRMQQPVINGEQVQLGQLR